MTTEPLPWRRAGPADAVALRDLERRASLAGLGHVFGAEPYPDADVLERWRGLLTDPDVLTEVVEGAPGHRPPVALVCSARSGGGEVLRHLAVEPALWGHGIGEVAVGRVVGRADGPVTLWCLERNDRALALYRRLGWTPTGRRRRTEWGAGAGRPWPVEVELVSPDLRCRRG